MSDKKPYTQSTQHESAVDFMKMKEEIKQDAFARLLEPLGQSETYIAKVRTQPAQYPPPPWLRHHRDKDFLYQPTVWIVSPGHSGSSLLHAELGPAR